MSGKPFYRPWRTSRELAGVRAQGIAALRACRNGATAEIDLKSLENLIEACEQAMQTERGHEHPDARAPDPRDTVPFLRTEEVKTLPARLRPKLVRLA